MILIDTHVLVWLYEGLFERIPAAVQARLNREQLALSPIGHLELAYLHQVGRITPSPQTMIDHLSARTGLVVADVSAAALCTAAIGLTWTRDPFDRLLAAHATAANLPLVTKDATLRQHLPLAWWAE